MLINNLRPHISNYRMQIDQAIARVLDRSWLVLGPEVLNFEASFASHVGVNHCVTVANGTDALELAMRALEIQAGDKVATVANAGMYTTTALLAIGAEPVFLDVDLETRVVFLAEIDRAIQLGVKAIVATHLYGQAIPDIIEIQHKCREHGVLLIEDCAQAHGAIVSGRRVGSFGDLGCFSFYPTKNLGALGDGGAIVSNTLSLTTKIKCLRQYGWTDKYQVNMLGARNSRLDELQAAILSVFLPHLECWNVRRREIASEYVSGIKNSEVKLPKIFGQDSVAHLFVISTADRNGLRKWLQQNDIATDVHYPIPDYRQPIFGDRYSNIYLPNTEKLANEVLTLPCYPEMSNDDIKYIVSAVNEWRVGALEEGN